MVINDKSTIPFYSAGWKEESLLCGRCQYGKPVTHVVFSDIIHMKVCASCAEKARKLGLIVISLTTNDELLN